MDCRNFKVLTLVLALFCLSLDTTAQERFLDKVAEWYPGVIDKRAQKLMAGYLCSLEFDFVLLDPQKALHQRREWNKVGQDYTEFLVGQWSRNEHQDRTALLLGGTHDDRAAVALVRFLKTENELKVRLAIYSALAELGYYTDYHARLLLAEHERRWPASPKFLPGKGRAEETVRLLTIIHHPEAIWAQDQLRERRLLDGAVAEEEGPLIKFRDMALGRSPLPERPSGKKPK